jgi:hypothetical protein
MPEFVAVGMENPVFSLPVELEPIVLQGDAAVLALAVDVGVADGAALDVPLGGAPPGCAPFGGAPPGGVPPAGSFIPAGMVPPDGGPFGMALSAGIDGSAVAAGVEVLLFASIVAAGAVAFTVPRSVTTSVFKLATFAPDTAIDNAAWP